MIDTHSHIYSAEFDDDRDLVVQRAVEAGVTHIILPNENLASVPRLLDTAVRRRACMGSHRRGGYRPLLGQDIPPPTDAGLRMPVGVVRRPQVAVYYPLP